MLREQTLKKLLKQKVTELKYPDEIKMFCRDCQNSLIDVLQKYRALETAHASLVQLVDETRQEAKSWEKVYMDLTKIVEEYKDVLETLKRENEWNVEIIETWEERRREEA